MGLHQVQTVGASAAESRPGRLAFCEAHLSRRRRDGRCARGPLVSITHPQVKVYNYTALQKAHPLPLSLSRHQCPNPHAQQDSCREATRQTEVTPSVTFCDTQSGDPTSMDKLWASCIPGWLMSPFLSH